MAGDNSLLVDPGPLGCELPVLLLELPDLTGNHWNNIVEQGVGWVREGEGD
jgi:hypothetical protein